MTAIDEPELRVRVGEFLSRRPTVGLAIGVVRDGHLESFQGHGVADIASCTPITEDTVFRIASITKTFTAIAVMQLWEQGVVDLDAPANEYLRAYRLVPAKASWRPATVRHLLTHTAGIPDDRDDPYAFRVDVSEFGLGSLRILFSREAETGRTALHLDVMPMSLAKAGPARRLKDPQLSEAVGPAPDWRADTTRARTGV